MTRFQFPLESALRLRKRQSELERAKYQQLQLEKTRLERALQSAQEERLEASVFVHSDRAVYSADLRALSAFAIGIETRRKTLENALGRIQYALGQQRQKLLTAEQNEKSLEKLREKRLQEWHRDFERETEITAQELWLFSHTTEKDGSKRR
jgi:flagellar protein FliJ